MEISDCNDSVTAGHPRVAKAAAFDIITPDLLMGPSASAAEAISILNDCLNTFANLGQLYEIHISHSNSKMFHMSSLLPANLVQFLKLL